MFVRFKIDFSYINFNYLWYSLSYWLKESASIRPVNSLTVRSNFPKDVANKQSASIVDLQD
jgi:hypothetical protein